MADQAKHTRGPWWAAEPEPRTGRRMVISTPAACGVAMAFTKADADLIAAAPTMRDALGVAAEALALPTSPERKALALTIVRAAIAQSEGR